MYLTGPAGFRGPLGHLAFSNGQWLHVLFFLLLCQYKVWRELLAKSHATMEKMKEKVKAAERERSEASGSSLREAWARRGGGHVLTVA